MNTVAEHLTRALRALPKTEKIKVIDVLLDDADFKEVTAKLITEKILGRRGNQEIKNNYRFDNRVTSKERGKQLRESYISELQGNGIRINLVDRIWAKTGSSLWVAIPTATTEWRPGRWFLGIPQGKLQDRIEGEGAAIILLCQSASMIRLDFVVPPKTVEKIVSKLSKSAGQLKFNIKTVGGRYYLVIPHDNALDISEYKGDLSLFQK